MSRAMTWMRDTWLVQDGMALRGLVRLASAG